MKFLCRFPNTCFVLCTFAWTWSIWLFLRFVQLPHILWKSLFVVGLSGPLIVSIGLSWIRGGRPELRRLVGQLLRWRFSFRWYVFALLLPPLLMLLAAELSRVSGAHWGPISLPSLEEVILLSLWMMVRSGPVNEELGWRGFFLPRLLQRYTPFQASLILGPIWALWHWPLWAWGPHRYWPYGLFFLLVMAMTFLFTWLYLRTGGSVLSTILFHTSINTSIKFITMLPPQSPSLVPFALWVGLTFLWGGLLVLRNQQQWFTRTGSLGGTQPGLEPIPPIPPFRKPA